jgi:hypothetical protein
MSRLAWTVIILFMLPYVVRITGVSPCVHSLVQMGSHKFFVRAGLKP